MAVEFCALTGGAKDRAKLVDAFQRGEHRILLSTIKFASEGVSLTSASRVILLDASWDAAQNARAASSVYRVGQTRDVEIYRLVSTGTLEEVLCTLELGERTA